MNCTQIEKFDDVMSDPPPPPPPRTLEYPVGGEPVDHLCIYHNAPWLGAILTYLGLKKGATLTYFIPTAQTVNPGS